MTRADHASGTDRVAEVASADSGRSDREHPGRRTADRSGRDRRRRADALLDDPDVPMGTLKKRIDDPRRDRQPQRRESGHRPPRSRHLLLPSARFPTFARRIAPQHRSMTRSSTSGCMSIGGISCWAIPICRWVRWSRPSGWSNCGRSKTAIPSGWSKPNTNPWAWIRPRTSSVSRSCSKLLCPIHG